MYSMDSYSLPTVRRMVDYFYTGDYIEESEEEDTDDGTDRLSVLSVHAAMFALAGKHNIKGLEAL